jgi:hypothetical protein
MGLLGGIFSILFPPPKQSGTLSVTVRDEEVKTNGEKLLADFFKRDGIRYQYEPLIEAGIWIFTSKVSRPDFYLQITTCMWSIGAWSMSTTGASRLSMFVRIRLTVYTHLAW